MFFFWPLVLVLLTLFHFACSEFVNVTIDDQYPDPVTRAHVVYSPDSDWKYGPSCTDCLSRPDPLQTRNGTWHYSTYTSNNRVQLAAPPKAHVDFSGSAVYVYCILSFFEPKATKTHMIFLIDDQEVGSYQLEPSGGDIYAYDVLVYANSTIGVGNHTLTIQNGLPDGNRYLMLLDYITFATDRNRSPNLLTSTISTATQSSQSSKIQVLTGVLVTICILFAIVLAYFLYRLFNARAKRPKADVEILPTPAQKGRSSVWKSISQYLNFNASGQSIAFNPSRLVANRPRLQSESAKDIRLPHIHAPGQRQSQPILTEDELETQPKKSSADRRWAFIMSWRDRAVREAEIPSLPPTSHAPTTVFSGPAFGRPEVHPLNSQRTRQQQEAPITPRTQPRRGFTVMNT